MSANLSAALIEAQKALSAPKKDRTVAVKSDRGSYKFDYATLDGIVEKTLRPVLPEHGLWFAQFVSDGQMVTRIIHSSGDYLDCGIPMPTLPPQPQQAGSLISYFKRYSLCTAFGLVAEDDDDANVAEGNAYTASDKIKSVSEDQLRQLQHEAAATGANLQAFCKLFRVPSLKDLPADQFDKAMKAFESKRRQMDAQAERKAA